MDFYKPLEDRTAVRVFELQPGTGNCSLQGRLLSANLEESPVYEAVSYVWGSEDNKVVLDCDGIELRITQNLAQALRRFRLPNTSRVLWTDKHLHQQERYSGKKSSGPFDESNLLQSVPRPRLAW